MKLNNKVALIVGGGGGIGSATARLFAQEGAKIMIADLDIEAASKVADEIKAAGGDIATVKVDITQEKDVQAMVKATLIKFGRVDILANIAGGSMGIFLRPKLGPFHESTKKEWDRILDVNLTGTRNCTRALINHMMDRHSGKIVNFSSIAGVEGLLNGADYSAAKAGIIGFTKSLAQEMKPYGVQVNCISPGGVLTERIKGLFLAQKELNPNGRPMDFMGFAKPEELAAVVLFLVTDEVSHLSGENIIVGESQLHRQSTARA